jgi:hypothetical protein
MHQACFALLAVATASAAIAKPVVVNAYAFSL